MTPASYWLEDANNVGYNALLPAAKLDGRATILSPSASALRRKYHTYPVDWLSFDHIARVTIQNLQAHV